MLKQFSGTEGRYPYASLLLSGSTLFGTTLNGGSSGNGTIFKLVTNGTGFATLTHFAPSDTANPYAAVTVSGDTLFGTAREGGSKRPRGRCAEPYAVLPG